MILFLIIIIPQKVCLGKQHCIGHKSLRGEKMKKEKILIIAVITLLATAIFLGVFLNSNANTSKKPISISIDWLKEADSNAFESYIKDKNVAIIGYKPKNEFYKQLWEYAQEQENSYTIDTTDTEETELIESSDIILLNLYAGDIPKEHVKVEISDAPLRANWIILFEEKSTSSYAQDLEDFLYDIFSYCAPGTSFKVYYTDGLERNYIHNQ